MSSDRLPVRFDAQSMGTVESFEVKFPGGRLLDGGTTPFPRRIVLSWQSNDEERRIWHPSGQ